MELCKVPMCDQELDSSSPKQGRYAKMCGQCRRGIGVPIQAYNEKRERERLENPTPPPTTGGLKAKARLIVPLAEKLEKKALASTTARAELRTAISAFSKSLESLRDSAKALIGGDEA